MRVLRALFIALLTAFVGSVLAFFVGDYLTSLAHVPEMEGQGDGDILPIRAPWDFGGSSNWNCFINRGSAAGSRRISRGTRLVASDCLRRRGSVSRRSLSVIGKTSNNRWQASRAAIRASPPAAFKIPDQPYGYGIRVSLYTDNKQSRFAFIDWNSIQKDTEHVMIPGSVRC